jgi:hypothetical protein
MRQSGKRAALTVILMTASLVSVSQPASAQDWISPEKRCPSPYGADDERGAANLQTPESVLAAARLIREGKIYELGKILDRTIPMSPGRSFVLNVQRTSGPNGRNQ